MLATRFTAFAALATLLVLCLAALMLLAQADTASAVWQSQSAPREAIQIQVGQHAVDGHARDALRSRLAVFHCNPAYLQVLVHDPITDNPVSREKWLFVCPNTAATLCAGMVVGNAILADGTYPEITAFVSTCRYWLITVPQRDGYTRAETVAVGKALQGLIAMWEAEQCK